MSSTGSGFVSVPGSQDSSSPEQKLKKPITNGAEGVISSGAAQSSYGTTKVCATAPSAGTAVQEIADGSTVLSVKNLDSTAANYAIIGFGTSAANAEANRDATNMWVVEAAGSDSKRIPVNATHYAWKCAAGTPTIWLGEGK